MRCPCLAGFILCALFTLVLTSVLPPQEISAIAGGVANSANAESDAMLALETSTFQADPVPNNEDVYNSWNLHLCALGCESIHSTDRTKLEGHPLIVNLPIDDVTFGQCTQAFVECNNQCQLEYQKEMKYWPPAEATWRIHTSSQLTICINTCGNEAVNDARSIVQAYPDPPNLLRDGQFSFCNQHLSNCTQECQIGFNEEMVDFQNQDD